MGARNVLAALLTALASVAACGEVTSNEDAGLCAQAACDDGGAGPQGGAASGRQKKANGKGAGAPQAPPPTELAALPCELCVRAEACCKAAGRAGCNYTAACTSATGSEQQFYLALCRAIVGDSRESATTADACGS